MKRKPQPQSASASQNLFYKAVLTTQHIQNCYQPGLQGLGKHSNLVQVSNSSVIEGSVDIDRCVQVHYPTSFRWDYALGYQGMVHFIEVHSTHTREVKTMIGKFNWLKDWLNTQAPALNHLPKQFHWIASGGNNKILQGSAQARAIAKMGLKPINRLNL